MQQLSFNCLDFFLLSLPLFHRQANTQTDTHTTHNHAHVIIRFSLKHPSLTHTQNNQLFFLN